MKLISPAKVNLYLKIRGKRADGFHELESLMQAIDLHDTLDFEPASCDSFSCALLSDDNLVTRARDLFRKKTGVNQPVAIRLEKRIPMEAGLGGGSSNAATTLWAMNELAGRPATDEQLMEWSSEIGSDIPFFFSSGRAICRGRGEQVENQQPAAESFWVFKPGESLSTARVFQHYSGTIPNVIEESEFQQSRRLDFGPGKAGGEAALASSKGDGAGFKGQDAGKDEYRLGDHIWYSLRDNDLEEPAMRLEPKLRILKESLEGRGCREVRMSGSGTALFCSAGDEIPETAGVEAYAVKAIGRLPGRWYELSNRPSDL